MHMRTQQSHNGKQPLQLNAPSKGANDTQQVQSPNPTRHGSANTSASVSPAIDRRTSTISSSTASSSPPMSMLSGDSQFSGVAPGANGQPSHMRRYDAGASA
ncbi:hypothetical protein OC846_002586 [Tilletia horrida]|uniref:Uncharacterized protein n=1 Tax=Tilletia horrida TaxID=155126 RepID=A0AAN6GQJ4_9BASI|nr:hypothetical protein OC845_006443 [Tilletia horrida]KAK0553341.1 hypothetical protein OC846_002586 [Tilletia horrida]KAK0567728.1 hypothetical protein OC861_002584 [Tilletia horrida]